MLKVLLGNWPVLAGLGAASWAILTYLFTRGRELDLKRTEHIFQQSQYLDNDKEMVECTLILYGKHPEYSVADFLKAAEGRDEKKIDTTLLMKFEKYLNFLWRICYAHLKLHTLSRDDMNAFGAYLRKIRAIPALYEYCYWEGYREITTVIDNLPTLEEERTNRTAELAGPAASEAGSESG
jgi:hypothetical protein